MTIKYLLLGAIGLCLIFLFWWFIKDDLQTEKQLRVHFMQPVPGVVKTFYERLLLVRRESANGPLLLKILNEDLVVRYHFDTQRSETAEIANWHAATEKIKLCTDGFGIEERDETGEYNTYGKYARIGVISPRESKLAIVSAAGPKGPSISLIPFLGGGPAIYGSRYLEVKKGTQPFENVSRPIRVVDDVGMSLCWTDEEDALIYFDTYTFSFSILDLNDKATAQGPSDVRPPAMDVTRAKPDLSRLTGNFRDYGIDADGDGLFEKIAIEIETETSIPGNYRFYLGLRSSDGKTAGGWAEAELKGGIEWTKILFDAEEWFKEGIEGEFTITAAHLDYGMGPSLELRENFGRTKKYSRDQFKRENTFFTGEQEYKLVDPDGTGRHRGLEFAVTVDVLTPGEYEYQSDLYFENWSSTADGLIDSVYGREKLRKGKNVITARFRGKAIIKYGKAGRFQLRNFLVYEKGKTGKWINEGIFTRPFEPSEFSPD